MADERAYKVHDDGRYVRTLDPCMSGRELCVLYDSGEEARYQFSSERDMLLFRADCAPLALRYGCLSLRGSIRMIAYEPPFAGGYACETLILDEENGLVTRAHSAFGAYPARPNLAKTDYSFGAVKQEGAPFPWRRHCFTCDLTGKKIAWTYGNGFVNVHIYLDHFCRAQALQRPAGDQTPLVDDPIYEEPAVYIKIRDGVYLMGVTEDHINRRNPQAGGNNLLLLMDMETLSDVGRCFIRLGPRERTWGFLHARGRLYEEPLETELAPSPNTV